MLLTVLIENLTNEQAELLPEPGLALFFSLNDKKILVDTGLTDKFMDNAKKLNIDIKDVDICIITHGHLDHTGGLAKFLSINKKAKIYMKPSAIKPYYTKILNKSIYVGIPKNTISKYRDRFTYVNSNTQILPNLFLITNIDKTFPLPIFTKYMKRYEYNKFYPDDLSHELFIAVKEEDGVKIISGCSHHGILNIIETAKKYFNEKITAVIGGFHLDSIRISIFKTKKESYKSLRSIANYFIKDNINNIFTCHCTGFKPYQKLSILLQDKIKYIKTGETINV